MRKALKIIAALLVVLILAAGGYLLFLQSVANDTITGDDGVATNYQNQIDYTQPLEKKYAQPGPYATTLVQQDSDNPTIGQYHIYTPTPLDAAQPQTFPLVVMVNGTFTPASDYLPILQHLASWGFIVIGNEDPHSGTGASTSETLDYALAQNNLTESPLFQRINPQAISIAGHSQGGAGAINAATNFDNSNQFQSIYTASAVNQRTAKNLDATYDTAKLTIPSFFMAGTGGQDRFLISPHKQLRKNFQALQSNKPAVIARRTGIDHKDVLEYGDPYMTAWFLWTLRHDPEAQTVFTGEQPELASNPDWQDIESKNLP